ncbi:RNA polymerase sigma factor [bacterium]|nr:RNA polymerase sigma factor [Bacteroidales bacterium]MCK5685889.1 RNA polymerase sigma factor [bacterium]
MRKTSDNELINKILDGDIQIFEDLVLKYRNKCMGYVLRLIKNRIDAEDIVQETFLKAYYSLEKCRNFNKFFQWITTIAHNLCMDYYKKNKTQLSIVSNMKIDSKNFFKSIFSVTPEKILIKNEQINMMNQQILNLPLKYRSTLLLKYVFEFSYNDISEILKIPVGTVRSRLSEAKSQIRIKLK